MIHDRVSMPRVLKHILLFTLGISGLAYIYNGSKEVGFGLSFTILASGILSTLASYGLISLIADIKKGKTFKGFIQQFIKKIESIAYDPNR